MISGKKFKRLDTVRGLVHEMLSAREISSKKREAWVHLFEVSYFASFLAMRRGQDSEITAITGFLHGFYFYKTGIKDFPGPNSANTVRPILRSTQLFNDEELSVILDRSFIKKINIDFMTHTMKLLKMLF
ncbi:hypothetical protein GRF59_11955 [Paenibacillus sp. HJL G12]|uniref:Uncharacterized protein n=1 Tax=Paenibacillus dendrobii TaxID=2691084 RepID=A0A7X3LIJ5_9BACL|nr:hypothetical protein [Paenibacillus dendrobii]MWV44344.1 hypothetical protein [Paenibacillus dendrobii]